MRYIVQREVAKVRGEVVSGAIIRLLPNQLSSFVEGKRNTYNTDGTLE